MLLKRALITGLGWLGLCLGATAQPDAAVRLDTDAISRHFSDVCDRAEVQDTDGTVAINHWHADGRLVNQWRNGDTTGRVTGRWYARDNQRCVVILSGLPGADQTPRCGPVFQLGPDFFSLNSDGSIHGIHRLKPMQSGEQPCPG